MCNDCPRLCGVDRAKTRGFCGCGANASVAKVVAPFTFEEPCLGALSAVFFGGCPLRCSYCQNYEISRAEFGKIYTDAELAELFDGAGETLDLVTPTHFLRAIESAVKKCKAPHRIIYNTSGYELTESVERAAEFTDVFLTDIKYADGGLSQRFSGAPDYFLRASAAVKRMRETKDVWENGILKRGLIVRHLVLPGCAEDSLKVLDFVASELGTDTVLSLMSQFTPNGAGEPSARLKRIEYKLVAEHAIKLGFTNGYLQDFSSASSSYTPKFTG